MVRYLSLNKQAGTYALILRSLCQRTVTIGKLGELKMQKGFYLYVGSAFGPGGVGARVKHHSQIQKSHHWHIDYLRSFVEIIELWYTYDIEKREHRWAKTLMGIDGVDLPLMGFGATDCRCESHLFFFISPIKFEEFRIRIEQTIPDHCKIARIEGQPRT